jgi:hypothetical protein
MRCGFVWWLLVERLFFFGLWARFWKKIMLKG